MSSLLHKGIFTSIQISFEKKSSSNLKVNKIQIKQENKQNYHSVKLKKTHLYSSTYQHNYMDSMMIQKKTKMLCNLFSNIPHTHTARHESSSLVLIIVLIYIRRLLNLIGGGMQGYSMRIHPDPHLYLDKFY